MEEKQKPNILIPVLAAILVLVLALCVYIWTEKNNAEKVANEYKASYEALVEEVRKARQTEDEAKKTAAAYQSEYNKLVFNMLDDAALAENMGNLIVKVWHNAIWNTSDEETDRFTKVNGSFVTDFNDALGNLFNDEEYAQNDSLLYRNRQQVKEEMKSMLNPPEGYENAFRALENMYNAYISFTNIILQCNGSLESFSSDFREADETLSDFYHAAELYVK